MDAVEEYKKRRKTRLDNKAVSFYRFRRDARLWNRMDDDGETNNKGGGGHGNTRIPFGLCQREGINVDPKWTPKDAWEALSGKGYSAGEVYKELKKTGKVPTKSAKKLVKLVETHFPAQMTSKMFKKNTMEFANFINDHCKDGGASDFLSSGAAKGCMVYGDVICKRSMSGEGAAMYSTRRKSDNRLTGVELRIPSFSGAKTELQKASAVRSFAHEYTHYLDTLAGNDSGTESFSGSFKELGDAIKNNDGMKMSDDVSKHFAEYNEKYNEVKNTYIEKRNNVAAKIANEMFGDNWPDWIQPDGSINYRYYWSDYKRANAYEKAVEKAKKAIDMERKRETRSLMDGSTCLQGMYDALSMGELAGTGKVKYGHSKAYYKSVSENPAMELFADYVALKATNPGLCDLFIKDKPEIARALDNTMDAIVKKLRGGTT